MLDLFTVAREHCPTDKARANGNKDGVTACSSLPSICEKCGLTRISHKISSEGEQDVRPDLLSIDREHYPRDNARAIESEDGLTDYSDLPRVCEKCELKLLLQFNAALGGKVS